jgi:hypothetical protein
MVGIGVSVAFITETILTWRVLELSGKIPVSIFIFNHPKRNIAKDSRTGCLLLKFLQDSSLV